MPYEIKKTSAGKFMFNLKAANHEVILTSEQYEKKDAAMNGIASVQTHGTADKNFEHKKSTAGQPYFVLKASNGQVIGKSEMYLAEAAAKSGMESVRKNAPSKDIKDSTG